MSETQNHPVWAVYDEYKTARLNVKYYSARLSSIERQDLAFEMILAISAPSSAIAGLFLWETPWGIKVWKVFGIIAAFVSVLKPLLKFTRRIKDLEKYLSGCRALEHDLSEIKIFIEQKKGFDKSLRKKFKDTLEKSKSLKIDGPENKKNKKLISRCRLEVNRELPLENFYIPKEE